MSMNVTQARQALERGDFDAAIQASERSLRRRPKDIAALTVLARARLAKGESNPAGGSAAAKSAAARAGQRCGAGENGHHFFRK